MLKREREPHEKILMKIGHTIQWSRKHRVWGQQEMCEKLWFVRSYVVRYESAHTGVSLKRISEIATVLGNRYAKTPMTMPPVTQAVR